MTKLIDLSGKKYGRVMVNGIAPKAGHHTKWFCTFDCGNKFTTSGNRLRNGTTKSCGCYALEVRKKCNTTHGRFYDPIYKVWNSMNQRCSNQKFKYYSDYGGRGIKVCESWLKFENFLADMGERPDGMTIDRVDNNKGYSPENCKWSTRIENANNKRNNRMITIGDETDTISNWCRRRGIKKSTVKSRVYNLGWSYEKAVTEPVRKHNNEVNHD